MMTRTIKDESGMTMIAVMMVMVVMAVILLAAAPSVQLEVQREKELEAIRRGEEIADAIREYVIFHRGQKLPSSMDDLLEGLPYGTKKRQILRKSSTIDPLSLDGEWRLVAPEPDAIAKFAQRVQIYNRGVLPSSPQPTAYFDRYTVSLANILNTETEAEDDDSPEDLESNFSSSGPFIGVASKSRSRSVIAYYGIGNHSKWLFTPLFRGTGVSGVRGRQTPSR